MPTYRTPHGFVHIRMTNTKCDESGWGPCNACHGTGERRHQWVF